MRSRVALTPSAARISRYHCTWSKIATSSGWAGAKGTPRLSWREMINRWWSLLDRTYPFSLSPGQKCSRFNVLSGFLLGTKTVASERAEEERENVTSAEGEKRAREREIERERRGKEGRGKGRQSYSASILALLASSSSSLPSLPPSCLLLLSLPRNSMNRS